MLQVILMWTGAVLAFGLLLVMALGPVIVEVDAWLFERRHSRRRARRAAAHRAEQATVAAGVAQGPEVAGERRDWKVTERAADPVVLG